MFYDWIDIQFGILFSVMEYTVLICSVFFSLSLEYCSTRNDVKATHK